MSNKKAGSEPAQDTSLLSMSQATGYFEIDELWPLWLLAREQGEAEAILHHAHTVAERYVFKKPGKQVAHENSKRWHIASVLARLIQAHRLHGHDSRYPHDYKDAQLAKASIRVPKGYQPPSHDFTVFPFQEGKARIRSDNPNKSDIMLEKPYG